jgi:hypothetical protein
VHELGYLPLAIDQAGSYIFAQQIELSAYLPRLTDNFKKVSSRKPKGNWPYGKTLFTTWELSLEAIEKQNPAAVKVLTLCAFLGPETITLDIFQPLTDYEPSLHTMSPNGSSSLTELTNAIWTKYEQKEIPDIREAVASFDRVVEENNIENLEETLGLLFTYSLATRKGQNGIAVHPLVLLWARERLSKLEQVQAARDAVVLAAEQNVRAMEPLMWMSRGFSQQVYPQIVRCYYLIAQYLTDELPNSEDLALLLAVERFSIDFVYSKHDDTARVLDVFLLESHRMLDRVTSLSLVLWVLPHSEVWIVENSDMDLQEHLTRHPFSLVELMIINNRVWREHGLAQVTNLEAFRSVLKQGPTHELDWAFRHHREISDRMEILQNLTRWEMELDAPVALQSPTKNVNEHIERLDRIISSFAEQCMNILSNRLLDRWLEGESFGVVCCPSLTLFDRSRGKFSDY